jgi:hypothetical protein
MKENSYSTAGKCLAKYFIIISTLLTSPTVWSQGMFSMGVEAGVNCSGLPFNNQKARPSGISMKEKELPLVRAMGGVWSKFGMTKHFYFTLAAQYTIIGSRYTGDGQGYDRANNVNFTTKTREDFTFNKFSFPVMVGYDFRIKKLQAGFFIGYRANLLTRGNFYNKFLYSDEGGFRDRSYERSIDPFDEILGLSARRFPKQLLVGTEVRLEESFHISFFCAAGEPITFMENPAPGADIMYYREYDRWDLVLSLKYTLLRFPKNESK